MGKKPQAPPPPPNETVPVRLLCIFVLCFLTVSSQPSLGGTYTGIEPMGLLWSVVIDREHQHKYPRFLKSDPTRPWSYTLSLIDGNLEGDIDVEHNVLDSLEIERHYLSPYVERFPVKRGCLKGMLFLPRNNGKIYPLCNYWIISIFNLSDCLTSLRQNLSALTIIIFFCVDAEN